MKLVLRDAQGHETAVTAHPGQKLSEAIWLSGKVAPLALCGGLGLCGLCKVRYATVAPEPGQEDQEKLSHEDLAAGWRLACHQRVPDQEELILELTGLISSPGRKSCASRARKVALGIDFGTTSIYWRAIDSTGTVAEDIFTNPQAGSGADVISRLAFASAPEGLEKLSRLSLDAINSILAALSDAGCSPSLACVAANSAMTEILLCKDVTGLLAAPYHLSFSGNEIVPLEVPGWVPLPTVIPPLPAPFIGGDIVAGLLPLLHCPRPFLLADLGTNAEFALLTEEDQLFLASAPLGPALEGIGPKCGKPFGPDVIGEFALTPEGIGIKGGNRPITGISATGYISLLALLLRAGGMDAEGHFVDSGFTPLAGKLSGKLLADRLYLAENQFLECSDVELLLKVKAAFRLALDSTLEAAGMAPAGLDSFYLAGALGEFARLSDLETLGFIPTGLVRKTRVLGNSSLEGACLLAANPEKLGALADLCANAEILQLAEANNFLEQYVKSMYWGNHESSQV